MKLIQKRKLIISLFVLAVLTVSGLFFYFYISSADKKPKTEDIKENFNWIFVSPSPQLQNTPSPKSTLSPFPKGIGKIHRNITATVFWVGEGATSDNNFISNEASAWDRNWKESYGGLDDPDSRNGFYPQEFTPRQNPFYFALPYNDLYDDKARKENSKSIPWYSDPSASQGSIVKNRWIQVGNGEEICFAQWEDVGPGETDDFDYVFGDADPENTRYGIDLSPAVRDCLKVGGLSTVWWQFIDPKNIPAGPWKEIVTNN